MSNSSSRANVSGAKRPRKRVRTGGTSRSAQGARRSTKNTPPRAGSKLEQKFAYYWRQLSKSPLWEEHRFHPVRQWRFDFASPCARVAIEVEGGEWVEGRHTRGSGFTGDGDKYIEAQLLGWMVFRLPGGIIRNDGNLADLIPRLDRFILARLRERDGVCYGPDYTPKRKPRDSEQCLGRGGNCPNVRKG